MSRFLNVDLELVASVELGPLLGHLSQATFTLRDSADDGRRTVWLELDHEPVDADTAIRAFVRLIESMPADIRHLWDSCEDRCVNVGIQGEATPDASAFRISSEVLGALSAASARLEFTVYGSAAIGAQLPRTKSDVEHARALSTVPAEALAPHVAELLVWLQDINWPVARPVATALSRCGDALVEPVRGVLRSDDDIWKLWVLSELLPHAGQTVLTALREDILRIAQHPTPGEQLEGAHLAARKLGS